MGGPLRKGYVVISGVILESVKEKIKSMVGSREFESMSQAVGLLLAEAVQNREARATPRWLGLWNR
jgi:Arc/MetJ-type ribon-helix-helix transcriptional regulator